MQIYDLSPMYKSGLKCLAPLRKTNTHRHVNGVDNESRFSRINVCFDIRLLDFKEL